MKLSTGDKIRLILQDNRLCIEKIEKKSDLINYLSIHFDVNIKNIHVIILFEMLTFLQLFNI